MSKDPTHALVNNLKMAAILSPLLEAVEINKRTEGVSGLNASDMFRDVIETGSDIYQQLLVKNNKIQESGLVSDKLFLLLALCLRNSTVLYNSPSLSVIKDDIINLFHENADFIQQYPSQVTGRKEKAEDTIPSSAPCAISAMAAMFIPVWLFHSNIFTSGLISLEQMNELNSRVCFYLKNSVEKVSDILPKEAHPALRAHIFYLCAESASKILVDYQIKLLKSKPVMFQYIKEPEIAMSRILPVMNSAWSTLNELTQQSMKNLTGKG